MQNVDDDDDGTSILRLIPVTEPTGLTREKFEVAVLVVAECRLCVFVSESIRRSVFSMRRQDYTVESWKGCLNGLILFLLSLLITHWYTLQDQWPFYWKSHTYKTSGIKSIFDFCWIILDELNYMRRQHIPCVRSSHILYKLMRFETSPFVYVRCVFLSVF